MKREADQLLNDVFGEAASAEFRDKLLGQTIQRARGRRWLRRARQGSVILAGLILAAIMYRQTQAPSSSVAMSRVPDLVVVHSQPIEASIIVRTEPGNVSVVASSPTSFRLVETGREQRLFKEIDDDELMSLLAGKPAALVRRGPHQVELIFLHAEDEDGFLVQ